MIRRFLGRLLGMTSALIGAGALTPPPRDQPTRPTVKLRAKSKASRPGMGGRDRRARRQRTTPLGRGWRGVTAGTNAERGPSGAWRWREWRSADRLRWEGRAKAKADLQDAVQHYTEDTRAPEQYTGPGYYFTARDGSAVGPFPSRGLALRGYRDTVRATKRRHGVGEQTRAKQRRAFQREVDRDNGGEL